MHGSVDLNDTNIAWTGKKEEILSGYSYTSSNNVLKNLSDISGYIGISGRESDISGYICFAKAIWNR